MTAPTPQTLTPRRMGQYLEPTPLDLTTPPHWSFLIQGASGAGKTHFVCSMPQPIVLGYTETNTAVVQGFAEGGIDLQVYPLRTWADYEWFVRRTKNREWDAQTVALDAYGVMGTQLVLEKAQNGANTTKDGNLKITTWNSVKNDQWEQVMQFVAATSPLPGKPAYHIAVAVHEHEDYERKTTGVDREGQPIQDQILTGIWPDCPGSFRTDFGARFDCVFIASERPQQEKDIKGVLRTVGSEHLLWTIPPDAHRHTKDGVGGKGGRKKLPPTVTNTFQALCAAWGIDPTTLKVLG